ncbi:MAG: carboxypeptidase-like regulatory domain-containing protein [Bacteroidota bacterium]|nr:carboxypeptidase-like regulatory domain-containing protein [Bacteroidota bacterium]
MAIKKFFMTIIVLCTLPILCYSQNITVNLLLNPNPSPYISQWKTNPAALGSIIISNQSGARDIKIRAQIRLLGTGTVFKCLTGTIHIKNVTTLTADKFLQFDNVEYPNSDVRNRVVQSGRLPEGSYNLCLKLEDLNGNVLTDNNCADFTIVYPSQPQLIAPLNNSDQYIQAMTFQWTPVLVPGKLNVHYVLKIAELLAGQTPNQALSSNYPFFIKEDIQTNVFIYPNSGQQFQVNKKYVWQVQALDQFGFPLTSNQGKSEMFTFTYKKIEYIPLKFPKILSPTNYSNVISVRPEFKWNYELHGNNVNYRIIVVPKYQGQNSETAFSSNTPIFKKTVKGILNYTPTVDLPIVNNNEYVLRIQVVNDDETVISASDLFSFKYLHAEPVSISPGNNQVVYHYKPEFKWSNIYHTGTTMYQLKVAVLNGGQTPGYAINNNPSIYSKIIPGALSHTPANNIPFKENTKYVYIIQVIDYASKIIASSDIKVFTFNPVLEQTSTVSGNLFYEFADMGEYIINDLKNVGLKLVVRHILHVKSKYTTSGGSHSATGEVDISDKYPGPDFVNNNKILGYCYVGSSGAFSFSFNNKDSLGQLVKSNVNYGQTSGEFKDYVSGDVYKVARLMVLAPADFYYTSPKDYISVNPGKSVNLGQAICHVRSYQTVFTMKPQINNENQISQVPISDMDVYLLRRNRQTLVPTNEGKPRPNPQANYYDYEIVAKGKSSILPENLGQVVFSRMVRNRDNNDEYYLYAKSDPEKGNMNYETAMFPIKFNFPNDKTVFADEYVYPTVYKDIFAAPLPPSVWGVVSRTDNGVPMKDAKVYLYKNDEIESMHITEGSGYFPKFTNLPVELDPTGHINGPRRDIVVGKPGYQTYKSPIAGSGNNQALKLGEKSFKVISIKPGMSVQGSVVDETGSGVNSLVKIGEGPFVHAVTPGYYPNPNHWNPATFSCQAEVNYNLPIIIQPDNHMYFDEYLTDNTIGWNAPKTFTVYKKLHRIKVFITERGGGEFPAPIYQARVRIKVQNGYYDKTCDANSNSVEFSFENDDSTFSVQVLAPEGKYYETLNTIITNSVSKTTRYYTLTLKKASFVSGKVLVGTDNTPVPYAHVFVEQGNSLIEAYTNSTGAFLLKNVPINIPITVWAVKQSTSSTNYIGDSIKVTVQLSGKSNLDFHLKTYNGIDITNLFGFPIEVKSLSDRNGNIWIKGQFINIKNNNQFALFNPNETLAFDSIYIKPSPTIKNNLGIPIAVPVNQVVQTNRNSLNIKVYNVFSAVISDYKIGVHLVDAGTGMGVIKGEVYLQSGAFNTQGKVSLQNFYVWDPNLPITQQNVKIPVLTPDGHNPIATTRGLKALSYDGKSIIMTINGFKTKIDSLNSYLNGDSLKLGTKIICSVPGFTAADQPIDIGTLVIHSNGVDPIVSKNPLIIPLQSTNSDWSINAQEWSFANDLVISKGVLKAAKIDVPIKSLTIKKNSLGNKQFDLTNLNIAKTIPLHITGNVVVDYNSSDSWYLFLSPGTGNFSSYFANLPGTQDTAKIYLQTLKATSTGKMQIAPWSTQPAVKIYSVTSLQPDMIDFYDEAISITGLKLDPAIPDFSGTSSIKYTTNTGSTKLTVMPFGITIWSKGVLLKFGVDTEQALSQVLNQNGFKSYGNISEPGKFQEIKAWLYHTTDSTTLIVENPFSPDKKSNAWQRMNIGADKTYLDKLTGRMAVLNGAWDFFNFAGDMTGTKGVTDDNKRMSFVVKGEVEANNQKVSIKNISTPFGDLKLTFDFENQRLDGCMQINQDAGGVQMQGAANLRVDKDGWYFYAGGTTTMQGSGPIRMAMLFGDYPRIEPFVKDEFAKASYKKSLPASFANSISGFFMSGSAEFPILIPTFHAWLAVATIDIGDNAGLDTRLWCSFDGDGTEFGIGNLGYVHIWAILQSITCTELGGDVSMDVGYEGTYNTSTHKITLDACTSISLHAWLTQKTPFVDFSGPTCIEPYLFDVKEGFDFRAKMHMDTDGGSSFKVEEGTCHD